MRASRRQPGDKEEPKAPAAAPVVDEEPTAFVPEDEDVPQATTTGGDNTEEDE